MERLLKCHSLLSIKILIIIDIRLLSNFTVFLIIIIQYNQHSQGNHSIIHIYQERKDLILLLKIATNYLVRKWKKLLKYFMVREFSKKNNTNDTSHSLSFCLAAILLYLFLFGEKTETIPRGRYKKASIRQRVFCWQAKC